MASRVSIQGRVDGLEEARRALEAVLQAARAALPEVLDVVGQQVVTEIRRRAPLLTGRLRRSYTHEVDPQGRWLDVGTNVEYACIYGAHTSVVTARGPVTIGQVRVGDVVLTQAGDWRDVTATSRFPVAEKPDLVTIRAPWRRGRDHRLTVTRDHKVLTHRDGRNLWLPAGDLVIGDLVYHRRKRDPKAGTAQLRPCDWCGKPLLAWARRHARAYCDQGCKNAAWADGDNPHWGMTRSTETRARMAVAARRRLAENPDLHPSRVVAARGGATECERQVADWLDTLGVEYVREHPVGRSFVDFWLPGARVIIEADGAYWHRDQMRDVKRDRGILDTLGDVTVIHMHFYDARWSPVLDPNPLPGVHYVACNPGPDSYSDPLEFEAVPVHAVDTWRWQPPTALHSAPRKAMLYDLSVEGVHSFVAGGLIVSNSYQEFGTRFNDGTPHFRPGIEATMPQIPKLIAEGVTRAERAAAPGVSGGGLASRLGGIIRRLGA